MLFGKAEWLKYFGDIGAEPSLPFDIEHILNTPCLFWDDKKVRDSHRLVLIPEAIEGRSFSLDVLYEIIQNPKEGKKSFYAAYDRCVKNEHGNKNFPSHWVLMTHDVIPGSRRRRYSDQKKLVEKYGQTVYRLPTALEAATSILVAYVQSGITLYSDNPWTYTRCQEQVNNNEWPVSVGGFSSNGLYVHDCRFAYSHDYIGVAAARDF